MLKEDIINEAVEYFAKQSQDKGISLSNNVSSGILIFADLDLIKIVFHNLISNAIKYGTVNGKIEVSSSFKNGMLEVSVYNDGIPLKEEEIAQLFKKFTRLMNKDYKKEKGTGLGLFITRQIINNHGGEIRIEPKDRGNAFIFCIPGEEQ
ncbi:MAG: HAMP domain-containing sensor histidine kinase [Candidatus Omnitrophica bacterium]|nr:HAMP domain-containing sensor histidine kinase [Candidatus Omnitrophota bacterium]